MATTLLQDPHGVESVHFTRLPTELLLTIIDAISAVDTVCLMLTCQRFHRLAADFSSFVRETNEQYGKDTILAQVERGFDNEFYCRRDYRVKRYWRYPSYGPVVSIHARLHDCGDSSSPNQDKHSVSFPYSIDHYSISRCNAVLVTNYHSTRGKHGVEASVLDHVCERWLPLAKIHVRESWETTVMPGTGELVSSCTRTYSTEKQTGADSLRRLFAVHQPSWKGPNTTKEHASICRHIPHFARALFLSTFPPLIVDDQSPRFAIATRCDRCHTYWIAEYRYGGLASDQGTGDGCSDVRPGPMVVLKTVHNLGDFRSPTNSKWLAMKALSD